MPRPLKCRRVAFIPGTTYFKPAGIPLSSLEEIRLSIEEAEAIRLKDIEGLEQEQGAEKMNVSRPTFQRVLASARRKIADALLNGKAIRIEGGRFEISPLRFKCINSHEWEIPLEDDEGFIDSIPRFCPTCNSTEVIPLHQSVMGWGKRGGRRYRRGKGMRRNIE